VTSGGEMDDREESVIEGEMDRLRVGDYTMAGSKRQ
jgi:hypothetical protein